MRVRLDLWAALVCLLVLAIRSTQCRAQSIPISPIKCHSQLADLGKQKDLVVYLAALTDEELERLAASIGSCANEAYLQLSRRDLKTAAFALQWAQSEIDSRYIDQLKSATASLQKKEI